MASTTRSFGVGWETAMGCVRRHGTPLVEDPERIEGVRALGVDEHKMLSANQHRHTLYATSFVDVKRGILLDVVRGRKADDVDYWLSQTTPAWRHKVATVAIDPHRGYLAGLVKRLPDAVVTILFSRRQARQHHGRRRASSGPERDLGAPGPQGRPALSIPAAHDPRLRATE